jgi:single-strand DNA-binding protein
MADGLNKVFLMGNVGNDPELKEVGSTHLLKMRMVTPETRMRDGEKIETKTWHTVVLWGKRAQGLAPHIRKGSGLFIEGKIVSRSYEDRNGDKKYSFEIEAYKVLFTGSGGGSDRNRNNRRRDDDW